MSDINNVLSTLCKYINSLINISLTAEHLRLAKYNAPDENVTQMLWSAVNVLSYYAARERQSNLDFRNYGLLTATKLYLAFLQYPVIEFYGLSEDSHCNRDLLIALAWLLGTQNALSATLRMRLVGGPLGTECSHVSSHKCASATIHDDNSKLLSTNAQICNVLHLNSKVNQNLKEISELISERGKLISKVHVASINVSGLPHLSVSELALAKRISTTTNKSTYSERDRKYLRDLHHAGTLLDTHAKWLEKRYFFFDWMTGVIHGHGKSTATNPGRINSRQLSAFISLLRGIINEKLEALISVETASKRRKFALDCASRLLRNPSDSTEAKKWIDELNAPQSLKEKDLQRNRERLAAELEEMLKLIPFSICV